MPKIAIVDFPFNYPPKGGSTVDLVGVLTHLSKHDFDIKLFVPSVHKNGRLYHYWNVGDFVIDEKELDFDVEVIPFTPLNFNFHNVPKLLLNKINKYKPDFVFIGDGFFMKPHLIKAFEDYKVILRFYAYELLCPNYIVFYSRFKNYNCRFSFIEDPLQCYLCFARSMIGIHKLDIYQWDFIMSLGFIPCYYHSLLKKTLQKAYRIIVYNELIKEIIYPINKRTFIIPTGINPDDFKVKSGYETEIKTIFATGRLDDPMKGIDVLISTCRDLRKKRKDFKLLLTTDKVFNEDYIESTGWLEPDEIKERLLSSDIYVMPSIWREPFGIGVIEAMACGIPVIASDGPGTSQIVVDQKTGFLVSPNNKHDLSDRLELLLDDVSLRRKFGLASRKRVEEKFS
ncbi:glycosyltransferase family 4 protein, partial [bacterium]|nr:glycosyltransferase family 4 protein [bacterium]